MNRTKPTWAETKLCVIGIIAFLAPRGVHLHMPVQTMSVLLNIPSLRLSGVGVDLLLTKTGVQVTDFALAGCYDEFEGGIVNTYSWGDLIPWEEEDTAQNRAMRIITLLNMNMNEAPSA